MHRTGFNTSVGKPTTPWRRQGFDGSQGALIEEEVGEMEVYSKLTSEAVLREEQEQDDVEKVATTLGAKVSAAVKSAVVVSSRVNVGLKIKKMREEKDGGVEYGVEHEG